MLKFTQITDFILPDLPYRFVGGGEDYSKNNNRLANLEKLKNIKKNYYKQSNLGRGKIGLISSVNCFKILKEKIKKDKNFLLI